MTIAVSVVVKTSRMLKAMLMVLCVGVFGVGVVISSGMVGELSIFVRLIFLFVATLLAIACWWRAASNLYPYRLDIGGTGQIRLSLLPKSTDRVDLSNNSPQQGGLLVRLLPDSTLWPRFMMLRLQDDSGRVYSLSVWPDSMSLASFRALAVACRWIAAHRFAE